MVTTLLLILIAFSFGLIIGVYRAQESQDPPILPKEDSPTKEGPVLALTEDQAAKPPEDVICLASPSSFFRPNKVSLIVNGKSFNLDFPSELKGNLSQPELFSDNPLFGQHHSAIPDLTDKLEKHKKVVAWDAIHSTGRALSNRKKYGFYALNQYYDEQGYQNLVIELYETDSFTDQVMHNTFVELKRNRHPISWVLLDNLSEYPSFSTCFELGLVLIASKSGTTLLRDLAPDSLEDSDHPPLYDLVTTGELSPEDYVEVQGQPDLFNGVFRSLAENLGLDLAESKIEIHLQDLYLDRQRFRVGILVAVVSPQTTEELVSSITAGGFISEREVVSLPFYPDSISTFLADNPTTPLASFALDRVGQRSELFVQPDESEQMKTTVLSDLGN